jgi:hypothetical protein
MKQQIEPGRVYWITLAGNERRLHVRAIRPSKKPGFWICESIRTGDVLELSETPPWQLDPYALPDDSSDDTTGDGSASG